MANFETKKTEDQDPTMVINLEDVFNQLNDEKRVEMFGTTNWEEVLEKIKLTKEEERKKLALMRVEGEKRKQAGIQTARRQIREVSDDPKNHVRFFSQKEKEEIERAVKRAKEQSPDGK